MGTPGELLALFLRGRSWWMVPLLLALVLVCVVALFLQTIWYIAPFAYTPG